ncbi:hypothetical protein CYY_001125 [Polysphondylium violaceum]|uniref:Uncharacterized protein n=1 Tax=Polysphondylium violaceum TaxID=133409 RepID=A0A8J4Q2E8_9MYCE|nr:hypothetical protein CYY_001125 [Polysphondylium violaceum]
MAKNSLIVLLLVLVVADFALSDRIYGTILLSRINNDTGMEKGLVLNLNTGTLYNQKQERYVVSKENLDKIILLLQGLNTETGMHVDLLNPNEPHTYTYLMVHSLSGRSITWQDGGEGNYGTLTIIEPLFERFTAK